MIPTKRPVLALALLAALPAVLGACQTAPRTRASAATVAACRSEVDRVYAAQNRGDLSRRDQIDAPFGGNTNVGSISDALSAQYGRDRMESSCLKNATAPAPADSATPKPVAPQ
jgi:hypothetical protein